MTKQEWKLHWRQLRKERKPVTLTYRTVVSALKNLYTYVYTPQQDAYIHLLRRYKKKIPIEKAVQKTNKIRSWRKEAKERAQKFFRALIYNNNPFLSLIPKNEEFSGRYIPVPINFGDDEK